MLLGVSFVFLPVIIILVMSRIFGDLLLKDGSRSRLVTFFALCLIIYVVLLVLVAQVHGQ